MRLIDADELIDHKFKSASERMDLSVAYMKGWNDAIDSINENAPTIEAEPVRHGKWIKGEKIYPDMLNDSTYGYWCSECHHIDVHGDNVEVLYCWSCGAKMDLDEVEDETKTD